MKTISMFFFATFFLTSIFFGLQKYPDSVLNDKVDSVLALMTIKEKIGQMNLYNGFWDATGPAPEEGDTKKKYDDLKNGLVGGILNVYGVNKVKALQKIAVKKTRLGIPLIFGQDVIHGHKTIFPIPLAEAASWDLEWIEKSASLAAKESASMGLNWTFAPMVDISRDARWGRVMEGAGEDPYYGSLVAAARVRGFQGKDLSSQETIAACAKHFAAYGFTEDGKDYNTVDVGTYELYNTILPPFKAAANAGVKTFMNSFNTLNGIPATGNSFLQRDILKNKWNYDGFIVSDWGSIKEMVNHGYSETLKDATKSAILAGSDMDMESLAYIKHLGELFYNNKIKMSLIDDAVRRILKVKFELGLFDNPYLYCNKKNENLNVLSKENMKASFEIAKRSIVLLKNENNILPLHPQQPYILVVGDLADDQNSPLGNWRLAAEKNSAVSVLKGLEKKSTNIKFVRGPKVFNDDATFLYDVRVNNKIQKGMLEAVLVAKKSDVVIAVMGEHGFQSGEGRSRANIGLPGYQLSLLKDLHEVNKNIILILMNGRPMAIPWVQKNIPVILEAWQLGQKTGDAVAEVIFGGYNPSGKLPVSFPKSVGQVPIYYNHYSTGRGDSISMVFWSHYSDESNRPLYPFGYGLSYTTFEYSQLEAKKHNGENDNSSPFDSVVVTINIKNTGYYDGEEVAQLYIRDLYASYVRPVKELKGFKKIFLKKGENKQVTFKLKKEHFSYYDPKGNFIFEPGKFDIMVGTNSENTLKVSIVL